MSRIDMVLLANCKYSDCAGDIGVEDIQKVTAIPKAPHHIALVALCPDCNRPGQYVVERTMLDGAREEIPLVTSPEERAVKAARIELDAIDTVNDLISLWASSKAPPLRDGLAGKCTCKDCKRKRYA